MPNFQPHEEPGASVMAMSAREELLKAVRALQIAPLQYFAWLRGVALPRLLVEVTGVSRSRLSNAHQKLRRSSELKMRQHGERVYRSDLAKRGFSESEIEIAHEQLRDLQVTGGEGWAVFWRSLDYQLEPELTSCVQSAVNVDRLLTAIRAAAEEERLTEAVMACARFLQDWRLPSHIAAAEGPGLIASEWEKVRSWDEVFSLADRFLTTVFFDQFAHVDAVWSDSFFSRLQARPAFALVAPRRRGEVRVEMPVRRLLQLSYALNHWARYRTWPEKPPQPTDLGDALRVRAEDVSNLCDGTTKLRFLQFEKSWDRFGEKFGLTQRVAFPSVLAAIAICWQHNLVSVSPEHKLRSFIILGSGYEQLWRWRRDGLPARSTGTEPWASWMDD